MKESTDTLTPSSSMPQLPSIPVEGPTSDERRQWESEKQALYQQLDEKVNSGAWHVTHWGPDKMDAIFADAIVKCIFFCENVWILIKVSLKFVPKGPIDNKSSLVQVMTWRQTGDKPLPEQIKTQVCVTQPQWVKRPRKMDHI